jgi:hypothetical protein
MKNNISLWIIAFIITAASAVFQRVTGPTYPVKGTATFHGRHLSYKFERSHGGTTDHPVEMQTGDESITGTLEWKRYKSSDEWSSIPMTYSGGMLSANLPNQPHAGKLLYRVHLTSGSETISLPSTEPVVIRFKGDVPAAILITHIGLMFLGMLTSTRAGLEIFKKEPNLRRLTYWSVGLLFIGGLLLGPIVQRYAFGAYWTGWPFGPDVTDDKTAFIVLAWIIAAFALKKSKKPQRWAFAAAVITILVYLIPHSVLGSELDYSSPQQQTISPRQLKANFLRDPVLSTFRTGEEIWIFRL